MLSSITSTFKKKKTMKVMELGPFWKKGTQSIAAGCNTWY
jgi:hypothetical protein